MNIRSPFASTKLWQIEDKIKIKSEKRAVSAEEQK